MLSKKSRLKLWEKNEKAAQNITRGSTIRIDFLTVEEIGYKWDGDTLIPNYVGEYWSEMLWPLVVLAESEYQETEFILYESSYGGGIKSTYDNGRMVPLGIIKSIEVIHEIKSLTVDSLSYPILFKEDHMKVECQNITREDALKIFKTMGDWLGYDVDD